MNLVRMEPVQIFRKGQGSDCGRHYDAPESVFKQTLAAGDLPINLDNEPKQA